MQNKLSAKRQNQRVAEYEGMKWIPDYHGAFIEGNKTNL